MLTIDRAKQQLQDSIVKYQKLNAPFVPNNKQADEALQKALQNASTWQELGVIAFMLPERFSLLQKPIEAIKGDYTSVIPMQFDVGKIGWYWLYATNADCKYGFLACVFYSPTKGMSTDKDTIFTLFGYVIENGELRPFSSLNGNVACPGSYTEQGDLYVLTLDLSSYADDNNVFVNAFQLTGTKKDFKTIRTAIGFKHDVTPVLAQYESPAPAHLIGPGGQHLIGPGGQHLIGPGGQHLIGPGGKHILGPGGIQPVTYFFTQTSTNPGVFEGKKGCAPCIGGAGTNYWSITYMKGTGEGLLPGSDKVRDLVGWFDHQWFNGTPHSTVTQIIDVALQTTRPPVRSSWIFVTIQPGTDVQYSASFVEQKSSAAIAAIKVGSQFTGTANKFQGTSATYGIKATFTIDSFSPQDPRLPDGVTVAIEGKVFKLKAACDGRVVLPDGTINLEAISLVYEADAATPVGVGCIEINGFHNYDDDVKRSEALGGIDASVKYFEPSKPPAGTSAAAITIIVLLCLLTVGLLVGIGFGIAGVVKASKK